MKQVIFANNISEIKLGGTSCSTALSHTCDGPNTICPSGTCVCETGYYDSDGDVNVSKSLHIKYSMFIVNNG